MALKISQHLFLLKIIHFFLLFQMVYNFKLGLNVYFFEIFAYVTNHLQSQMQIWNVFFSITKSPHQGHRVLLSYRILFYYNRKSWGKKTCLIFPNWVFIHKYLVRYFIIYLYIYISHIFYITFSLILRFLKKTKKIENMRQGLYKDYITLFPLKK